MQIVLENAQTRQFVGEELARVPNTKTARKFQNATEAVRFARQVALPEDVRLVARFYGDFGVVLLPLGDAHKSA